MSPHVLLPFYLSYNKNAKKKKKCKEKKKENLYGFHNVEVKYQSLV